MAVHNDFRKSLIKFCQSQIAGLVDAGLILPGSAEYVDFDAHSQMTTLPEKDLVGTANFSWVHDGAFYDITVAIGVSTWQDTNLFRHHEIVDFLQPNLMPTKKIPVVDATTGIEKGWMIAKAGLTLMPMAKTDVRSAQFLLVNLTTDQTAADNGTS